ncbi:UDP-2,4-diacetamido-2,4,6-trideoxy-beta-L-altropyranose hydrolase [Paludicola sp. MB14-C6]|uniref:UDP-2,4-diacetamido-2,4, 6-trideoxy-beta-L-altropyranose hydrolase n=1 Tax=Paludihabitans sp. MB14-C6 TaxID=3070656 RepID=UPI0027DB695C|nr:UDP-2,4-diacetamido-2,4,6-trideoxy-beta-L-altropyranose hydrolase [Paludicola sp. MB14-C6]WMJ24047.1 UDP-2,4-diacetamido-2,4,6-trideoxy-beta-L-altropyranose hydrolase [Paludicola sp. MB14-C6]
MIAFRVDANKQIGLGHIMRCISVAKELVKRNVEVLFITADYHPTDIIKKANFQHIVLDSDYKHLENEVELLLPILTNKQVNCLIVDSYFISNKYFETLKNNVLTAYIDDLAETRFSVDILINYNIFSDYQLYEKLYQNSQTKLLLGAKYAPLREEFQHVTLKEIGEHIEDILITTGGTDPYNICFLLAKHILKEKSFRNKKIHIVIGNYFTNTAQLKKIAKHCNQLHIYENIECISQLLLKCDIAISASGTTLYELCACGTPSIIFSFADNQTRIRKAFGEQNVMRDCGDFRTDTKYCIQHIMQSINELENKNLRILLCQKELKAVDGHGAYYLATQLLDSIAIHKKRRAKMIINENNHDKSDLYTPEIKEYVEEVFRYICSISELRNVLDEIKKQADLMKPLFISTAEQKEKADLLHLFHIKMQNMTYQTLKNMEQYQLAGWKELIYDEGNDDENE